jgi:hypothetical protein
MIRMKRNMSVQFFYRHKDCVCRKHDQKIPRYINLRICYAHLNWSSVTPLPIAAVELTPPDTIFNMLST